MNTIVIRLLRATAAASRAVLAVVLILTSPLARAEKAERPNVVLIMADDMGYECVGAYGGGSYRTPRIDALAAQGIRFVHAYSTPLCTPSRVQLMTGKYNARNYVDFGYLPPQEKTIGHLMKDAGYATMIAGKWQLNGITRRKPGWENNRRPFDAGFDEYSLWQVTRPKSVAERYWDPLIEQNGDILRAELAGRYGPDHMSDYVCDFIRRKRNEPFFVYYPSVLTHDPFIRTPDSQDPETRGQAAFADMVAYFDKIVGKIHDQLEALDLLEKTLILVTADNGTHRSIRSQAGGLTIRGGKGTTPDAGTRVPFIAYWKGKTPRGVVSRDLIDFTDVLPTLAALAGADSTSFPDTDGLSFLPALTGAPGKKRDWIYCHYDPRWGRFSDHRARFARTRRFKLYHDGRFYDVPADVLEERGVDMSQGEIRLKGEIRAELRRVLESMPPLPKNDGRDGR